MYHLFVILCCKLILFFIVGIYVQEIIITFEEYVLHFSTSPLPFSSCPDLLPICIRMNILNTTVLKKVDLKEELYADTH